MVLNHLAGLVLTKVDDFRFPMKGKEPLLGGFRNMSVLESSRLSKCLCHSDKASRSISERAAECDTNSGRTQRVGVTLLAAALAFLSVMVMWSRPPWPGVQLSLPLTSILFVKSLSMFDRNRRDAC